MNDTEKNLLEAFSNYVYAAPPEYTYRIYYDKLSGDCLYTDVELHDDPCIEVDRITFENFNPVFYRVIDGKLKSKQINYHDKRILIPGDGVYKTIKGSGMFLVDNNYNGETTTWKYNDDN
jgi:hypothetical protein